MKKRKRRINYIDYDYENEFIDPLDKANDSKIEKLLKAGKIHSVYATKTIRAGTQFEVEIYPEFTKKQNENLNLKKRNNKAQKNLNDKNARKRVERLINTNFTSGDVAIHLTYDNKHLPATEEEAFKNMKNYIRRINYKRKRKGLEPAKYIYVTEHNEKKKIRYHHHLVIDGAMSMDELEDMWKYGDRNQTRKLAPDENGLTGLANYLVKDPLGNKRWCSSLNLKKPKESKSYHSFKARHVEKMVANRDRVKEMLESKYKNMILVSEEIKYNEINERFYIYARMRERRNE